jgi:hypothetical protein
LKWDTAIQLTADNQRATAAVVLTEFDAKAPMDTMRAAISAFLEQRQTDVGNWEIFVGDV